MNAVARVTSPEVLGDLATRLRTVPGFFSVESRTLSARRLGGVTNDTYLVRSPGGSCVLKLFDTANHGLQREVEVAQQVADLGVAPELLAFDTARRHCAFRFIENGRVLLGEDLSQASTRDSVFTAMRALHRSDVRFSSQLDPALVVREYLRSIASCARTSELVAELEPLAKSVLGGVRTPQTLVPSHGDLVPENVLLADGRAWLLDWEYAAMADPLWDLAYLIVESKLPASVRETLLASTLRDESERKRCARVELLVRFINLAWCALQIAQGNHRADFASIYHRRYDQLCTDIASRST